MNLILKSAEPVISNTFKTALKNVGCTIYDYLLLKHMKQRAAKLSNSSLKKHVISVSEYFATEHKASYFGSTNATTTNGNWAEIQIKPEVSHSVLQEVGWGHQEAVLQAY